MKMPDANRELYLILPAAKKDVFALQVLDYACDNHALSFLLRRTRKMLQQWCTRHLNRKNVHAVSNFSIARNAQDGSEIAGSWRGYGVLDVRGLFNPVGNWREQAQQQGVPEEYIRSFRSTGIAILLGTFKEYCRVLERECPQDAVINFIIEVRSHTDLYNTRIQ